VSITIFLQFLEINNKIKFTSIFIIHSKTSNFPTGGQHRASLQPSRQQGSR